MGVPPLIWNVVQPSGAGQKEFKMHELFYASEAKKDISKDDILNIIFTADGPLSRADFHLKGQESSDWAALIKRVQTGEIDADRAQEYVDELEEAKETAVSFPTQCPNCFAAVPTPARGIASVACEFCNATITPEEN